MNTQEQGFPPAPVSPEAVPGISDTTQQPELSQEEMVANLKGMMGKIDEKYQGFQADKFGYDNKLAESKSQALREIFDLLQSLGIDPSNLEQVKAFLDKIKEKNPELYQQVEKAFQDILGEDIEELSQEVTPEGMSNPLENMNINNNETSQENI